MLLKIEAIFLIESRTNIFLLDWGGGTFYNKIGDDMKDKKIMFGITLAFIFFASVGFSYAYFSSSIVQNEVKDQVVETGTLQLTYTDGPEINVQNIKPGNTINKTITVKNTGSLDVEYNIIWQELTNEIINDEMLIEGTCTRINGTTEEVDGTCENIVSTPINSLKIKKSISIEPNIMHKYDLTITFKDTGADQNYNQGKKFGGVLGVENAPEVVNCTFDGEVTQGAEYVNGIYTYRYMQENSDANESTLTVNWKNMDVPGWGVALTNPSSTEDVSTKGVCTYINDVPIIYMGGMFALSQARNIDLSRLNTSNVISMSGMFGGSSASTLDLSNLDTSNVIDMNGLFYYSNSTSINLKGLDTSKVIQMGGMFRNTLFTTLDLSSFDTSNVINMYAMFYNSKVKTIYASNNFITANVTSSTGMFEEATNLVGGNGTKYNSSYVDKTYARIDGGTDLPGYFTKK